MKKKIAVLYGGKSQEHDVSRMSALNIFKGLDLDKFEPVLVGITSEGLWYLQPEVVINNKSLEIIENKNNLISLLPENGLFCGGRNLNVDFIYPALHGENGEDGTVQGLFELIDLPYAGSGVLGSSAGMDKDMAKRIWRQAGIPVTDDIVFLKNKDFDYDKCVGKVESEMTYPVFVKPANAGSSVGTAKAVDADSLKSAVSGAFEVDSKVLVEPFINAREIEFAVLGLNESPVCYGPGEITPHHEFYDFDAKYNDPDGADLLLHANLNSEQLEFIRKAAVKAYQTVGADGYSRVDFFVDKNSGEVYLNEINTLPGFTSISMFPKMCEDGGISLKNLLTEIISLGFKRYESRKKQKLAASACC